MGAVIGIGLGALNTLIVAIAFSLNGNENGFFLFMFGVIPGMGTGAVLGFVGDVIKNMKPIVRWFVLAVPAVMAVAVLGDYFEMHSLILYASMPTVAVATMLERLTRAKPAPPPIPVARAS